MLNYPQMSSFDGEDARTRERDSGGATFIKRIVKMPMVNINKVIDEHFAKSAPDFLSVDTEGLDLTILKTIDFGKFRRITPPDQCPLLQYRRHERQTSARSQLVGCQIRHIVITLPPRIGK